MSDKPVHVLLVEDDPSDVSLLLEAFKNTAISFEFSVAKDGNEAMRFLRHEGTHTQATRPDLILLDLNLPGKNGYEVLSEVKADEALKSIPVIILTTSDAHTDIAKSHRLNAHHYLTKPFRFDQFGQVVESLETFWREQLASRPGRPT